MDITLPAAVQLWRAMQEVVKAHAWFQQFKRFRKVHIRVVTSFPNFRMAFIIVEPCYLLSGCYI